MAVKLTGQRPRSRLRNTNESAVVIGEEPNPHLF
jgi:hypothetical protein